MRSYLQLAVIFFVKLMVLHVLASLKTYDEAAALYKTPSTYALKEACTTENIGDRIDDHLNQNELFQLRSEFALRKRSLVNFHLLYLLQN